MSSVKFADKPENAKIREELRIIREELLKRAQNDADKRPNKTQGKETTSRLSDPLKKEKKKKSKHKHKKHKKSDRDKSKERKRSSSKKDQDSDSEESEEEEVVIQKKEDSDPALEMKRDDWMTSPMLVKTFSKNKPVKTNQNLDKYEPGTSSRELNPHWKNGGTGLPTFRKPKDDSDDDYYNKSEKLSSRSYKPTSGGWKKTEASASMNKSQDDIPSSSSVVEKKKEEETRKCLTDQEMNELGAKIMKAEILNNNELADELRKKLASARLSREQLNQKQHRSQDKGKQHKDKSTSSHRKGKDSEKREKPHTDKSGHAGKRVRNFDDNDEYDIKNKFEKESKSTDSVKTAEKQKHFKEDLDDIFSHTIQEDKEQEIRNHTRSTKKLNNCDKCFNSSKINNQLVVSVGKHVYLALPWHEGLQTNHCLIIPIDHYSCSTDLDEDVWEEVSNYRKVLTKLFADRKEDVIFFETARYLQKRSHMVIHCVPSSSVEMAPFYFKKAIQESEYEWSKNKQLVMLKEKGLRRSIPVGLPYFWVNFGMDYGFAHVIENQEGFPSNFAQEIIGGMLELNMNRWRCPKQLHNVETKVKNLADLLKPYDLDIS